MGGWLAQCADLLKPLYGSLKEVLFDSKVIGTDDTSVKVLDKRLPFARTGRIWPYYGDSDHPVILYDYTQTRERRGPEEFLKGYRGYLQADAYGGYDAFFKDPARGPARGGMLGAWPKVLPQSLGFGSAPYGSGAIADCPTLSRGEASPASYGGRSASAPRRAIAAHSAEVA
jgi:hypothetical protein